VRLGDPATCGQHISLGVQRRPANALNIEVGQPLPRCRLKLPEHWSGPGRSSLRWLASGGSPLVFGLCTPGECPSAFTAARSAIEAGLVLHAAHPNFGGTVTLGPYHVIGAPFAMISHGCGCDLDEEFKNSTVAVRVFEFHVGRARALDAALAAMEKAG
jgi:hypothetical protein